MLKKQEECKRKRIDEKTAFVFVRLKAGNISNDIQRIQRFSGVTRRV